MMELFRFADGKLYPDSKFEFRGINSMTFVEMNNLLFTAKAVLSFVPQFKQLGVTMNEKDLDRFIDDMTDKLRDDLTSDRSLLFIAKRLLPYAARFRQLAVSMSEKDFNKFIIEMTDTLNERLEKDRIARIGEVFEETDE